MYEVGMLSLQKRRLGGVNDYSFKQLKGGGLFREWWGTISVGSGGKDL